MRRPALVTSHQLRLILSRLRLSQVGAARFLGRGSGTIYRWLHGDPIPEADAMLLALMDAHQVEPNEVRRLAGLLPLKNLGRRAGRPWHSD